MACFAHKLFESMGKLPLSLCCADMETVIAMQFVVFLKILIVPLHLKKAFFTINKLE